MAIITRKHGVVTMKDATGSPIIATLSPGPGDFSYSGAEQNNVEGIAIRTRGSYQEMVDGDSKEISGSITLFHDGDLTDATNKTAIDAVMKTGAFASGVSTDPGGTGGSWTTDIVLTSTRNAVVHTSTFLTCRCTVDYAEAQDGNKITINFKCFEGVTYASA